MAGFPSQRPPHRQMRPVPPTPDGSGWAPQPPQQFQQQQQQQQPQQQQQQQHLQQQIQQPTQQQNLQQPNLQMNQQQQPFQPQPNMYQQQLGSIRPQPPSIPPSQQRPMRPQPSSLQPQQQNYYQQQQHQPHLQQPPPQMHRPQQSHSQQSLSQHPQPQLRPQPPLRPIHPQSNPNVPPYPQTMSQTAPPAMRPPPNYQPDPSAFSAMSLHPAATGPPPGMQTPTITDPRTLPRPQTTGQAVSLRIISGDPPTQQTIVDPAACPTEIFKPASTRAVRLCNTNFPSSGMLSRKYGLPLGAVVHPLAPPAPDDDPVPIVNFGATGIVRCRRCRSYINFTCSFRDGGRRWICTMCSYSNEVPSDYFAPLDQNGKRTDAATRPELHRGSVEFVAPAEYMVRPPMPPVYLFLLETTPAAANSGVLEAAVMGIKRSINSMPSEGRTKVGIVTFDSAVQFFALKPGEDAEPASYVVSDINDIFLPTPQSIMVQLDECRPCFERALDTIAATHKQTANVVSAPSCLGAALKGAQRVLEHTGGKILIVAASRPTVGPGALRERGDNSLLGTDRERAILRSDSSIYSQMAVAMSKYQISCDLFMCVAPPGRFIDLSSLAPLVKFTGGELFFCPLFVAPKDAPRLQLAINRTLARETGLEAVMRIRATRGVRCTQFSGRFFVRSTDLLAMPNVDSDKAYAVQFAYDESTLGDGPFCLQVALLYTTTSGERRIRVHTLSTPITKSLSDLFMTVDAAATANVFLRQAAEGMKDRALSEMKKNMIEKVMNTLAKYREVCINQYPPAASTNQLLLPNSMLLLPLFMHGLVKTPILSRDAAGAFLHKFDDKSALAHSVDVMSIAESSAMLYPNVIPIYPWPGGNEKLVKHPDGAAATVASLQPDIGVLIDHGRSLILWLGQAVLQKFTTELLGNSVTGPVDPRYLGVELMRRGASAKGPVAQVFSAVTSILDARRSGLPLLVVPAGDQLMQPRVEALMTEDRTASTGNYREFLLEMQNRVSQIAAKR